MRLKDFNPNCGALRGYTKRKSGDEEVCATVTKEELNPLKVPTEEEITVRPEQISMDDILKLRDWHLKIGDSSNSIVCLCGEIVNLDDYLLHRKCLGWTQDMMRIQTRTSYKFAVNRRFWRMKQDLSLLPEKMFRFN